MVHNNVSSAEVAAAASNRNSGNQRVGRILSESGVPSRTDDRMMSVNEDWSDSSSDGASEKDYGAMSLFAPLSSSSSTNATSTGKATSAAPSSSEKYTASVTDNFDSHNNTEDTRRQAGMRRNYTPIHYALDLDDGLDDIHGRRPSMMSRRRLPGSGSLYGRTPPSPAPSPAPSPSPRAPSLASSSVSSSSVTINSSSSSSSARHRSSVSGSSSGETSEHMNPGGLRASLDAGMAAVRRWISSRSNTSSNSNYHDNFRTIPSSPPSNSSADMARGVWSSEHEDLIDTFSSAEEHTISSATNSSTCNNSLRADSVTTIDSQQVSQPQHQDQNQRHPPRSNSGRLVPETITEEREGRHAYFSRHRQRALSEPDAVRIRDLLFQRALSAPQRSIRRRRMQGHSNRQQRIRSHRRSGGGSIELRDMTTQPSPQLSPSAAEVLYSTTLPIRSSADVPVDIAGQDDDDPEISAIDPSIAQDDSANRPMTANSTIDGSHPVDTDPNREARMRWIRINRRFQVVITVVALIFSLLLFAILVCWVVLTSAYVVSIDKYCDVPLKPYFWLVTLQLILDVFRTDIMRLFLRWDANSNQRIPCRVIAYNAAYLVYALLVLRLGIRSVFVERSATCRRTAPELFQSSAAFVSLSVAAWTTIILGYLFPFCLVAALLTWNGYTPASDNQHGGTSGPFTVFPTAMGAPPECVDQLRIVTLDEFPADYPMECCICMENFTGAEVIVETECNHVFHKSCCREWLRQARTCPVCRMDIPAALEHANNGNSDNNNVNNPNSTSSSSSSSSTTTNSSSAGTRRGRSRGHSRLGFGPASRPFSRNNLHHEVASLLHILRRQERRLRVRSTDRQENRSRESGGVGNVVSSSTRTVPMSLQSPSSMDGGLPLRSYPQV